MKFEDKKRDYKNKGGVIMAVLAKPGNRLPVIRADKSREFLEEANRNILTSDFLRQCKESSKLFKFVRK